MFSSLRANLTKKVALLSFAVASTSATVGGVTSYYLFSGPNNDNKKEKIEKINSELEEARKNFLDKMQADKQEKFAKRWKLVQKEFALKRKIGCLEKEMGSHDNNLNIWGISSHTTKFESCEKIEIVD